jgi:hypothetical protein
MNSLEYYFNKSNLRIADSDDNNNDISPLDNLERINNRTNFINNFDDNNNNTSRFPIIHDHFDPLTFTPSIHCINNRFASFPSSPSLEDPSNTVSFATLNVRGFNNPVKFDSFLDDLFSSFFSIIGLQETRISERSASPRFKEYWHVAPNSTIILLNGTLIQPTHTRALLSLFRLILPNTFRKSIDFTVALLQSIYTYLVANSRLSISTAIRCYRTKYVKNNNI